MTVIFSIYRWSDFLNGPSLHLSSWSLREAPYNALNKHDEETPGLKVQTHRIILTELKFRSKVNYPTLLTEWKHHIAFDNITYEALNDLLLSFVVFMVKAFLATSSSKQFNVTLPVSRSNTNFQWLTSNILTFMTSAQRLISFIRCFHEFY